MKSFFVILSAAVFLAMAGAHLWRVYAGIAVVVAGQTVPMNCSYAAAAISAVLGLGLLLFARK
jgi:hypothetical protein